MMASIVELFITADSRTTAESLRAIPQLLGNPRPITFFIGSRTEQGYALTCRREYFGAVKRALEHLCPGGLYTYGTWSNVFFIDFRVPGWRVVNTHQRMIVADASDERGIKFDDSSLRYTFVRA